MDSITQFMLGAAIGGAVMAPRVGAKALLIGGVVATLPDLDSFIPYGDPIDTMTHHRGFTHSLLVQTIASPAIAWGITRMIKSTRDHFMPVLLMVWLCLVTHALLDSLTTYGTQLMWPFESFTPAAYPAVFIIDPFYSFTLLVGVLAVAFLRKRPGRGLGINKATLSISSAYLALGMLGHAAVAHKGETHPGFEGTRLHVQPTPLNILFWQVTGVDDGHYYRGYVFPFPGCRITDLRRWERMPNPPEGVEAPPSVKRLEWFTDGFYTYQEREQQVLISDLRIGIERSLPFTFSFANKVAGNYVPKPPEQALGAPINPDALGNLITIGRDAWARCSGENGPPRPEMP